MEIGPVEVLVVAIVLLVVLGIVYVLLRSEAETLELALELAD